MSELIKMPDGMLVKKVDDLEALLQRCINLLKDIEWKPVDNAQGSFCPSCENLELWNEHNPECVLDKLLNDLKSSGG